MPNRFALHPQLARDCAIVGHYPLCLVLLMLDANYPWFILVPQRVGVSEIFELSEAEQRQLLHESALLSRAIMTAFHGDKLNLAALGNIVPQLHIHHVVRQRSDPAWPAPVWGAVPGRPYDEAGLQTRLAMTRRILAQPFSSAQ
jgi:diadenosine tetraphosphate (Ap4A) HIT family hydrolase